MGKDYLHKLKEDENMEIHFYEQMPLDDNHKIYVDYVSTKEAIENRMGYIVTTQMCCLATWILKDGYRLFIHFANGDVYEVELGKSRTPYHPEIRLSKNLYQMWKSGLLNL